MAGNKGVNLKVFFQDDVRRLTVDESVCTNYMYLREKLQNTFPVIRDTIFRITWKDSDGDQITISSDEDLITAYTETSADTKALYITSLDTSANEENSFRQKRSHGQTSGNAGCPFSGGEFDVNNMQTLGAMAQQYLGPFMEALNSQNQGGCPNRSGQEGPLMDIIRNAAQGFLGQQMNRQQGAQTQNADESKPSTSNAQSSFTTTSGTSTQANSSSNSSSVDRKTLEEALAKLQQMGFSNENGLLTQLLECFGGSVPKVVKALADMKLT